MGAWDLERKKERKGKKTGENHDNDILRATSTERSTLLRLKRTSSVNGIGKRLLARNPVVLADRTFPGESLSQIQFPTIAVTKRKGKETTTSQTALRMNPMSLPLRKRKLSSPDSPGKGESVSCRFLFPKLFQSMKKRNQRNGLIRT